MIAVWQEAAKFLVTTCFDLYILAVILRFFFQFFRMDFYNPLAQFIIRITNPLLVPLRKYIPGLVGLDVSSLVLMYVLKAVEIILVSLLKFGRIPSLMGILFWSTGELLGQIINLFWFSILIVSVFSWFAPRQTVNPIIMILQDLTAPLLRVFQRITPRIAGLDLSPLFALIGLQLINLLMTYPLVFIGQQFS